ncbi:DinB family protein [Pontibacter mangrovi]|uniref:DinB family protein n=1 Tax=Pontibacter mangrovi TaxID=2589816 RepID=A0A501VXE3_9BACT|nr:DUF1569 domain-containing protein [Pontibacter mangrovi]TPE42393.1 DinB family protein [Pontibacter mangrovi]
MKNVFEPGTTEELLSRLDKLRPDLKPAWGKMSAPQMLAHCNVAYEMVYEDRHPKPGALKRYILRLFVKNIVVGEKPYKQGSPTTPAFKVSHDKDFQAEKERLTHYIRKTQALGPAHFEGRDSHSFGPLTAQEWSNMFYKHLDHHLRQFRV